MEQRQTMAAGVTGPIGICLSGGGFRASAFHLGTLAYLDRVGLLEQLSMISTVSGGSFTGAKFALSLVEEKPFSDFFKEFYFFHRDTELVPQTLENLVSIKPKTPATRNSLIISMAQVYADTFLQTLDKKTGKKRDALFSDLIENDTALRQIVINSTEFRYGLDFRFQKSSGGKVKIGNGRISIPVESGKNIRLADIVAASSCFPAIFEPIAFPDDFTWAGPGLPEDVRAIFSKDGKPWPLALMDGGIYDNQGIQSLMLSDARNIDKVSMFIISDVFQLSEDLYPFPVEKTHGFFTLENIDLFSKFAWALCALTAVCVGIAFWRQIDGGHFRPALDLFLYILPLLLAGSTAWGIRQLRKFIYHDLFGQFPYSGEASWDDFKKLTVQKALDMIRMRAGSLFALSNSLFLKRIRALLYQRIYSDKTYENKRISNLVYHLKSGNRFARELKDIAEIEKPSELLYRVTDCAATMKSSLWFKKEYELPSLVAGGQATICYNLMKYVVRLHGDDKTLYPDDVAKLWEKLANDWNNLVKDPYVLLKHMMPETRFAYPPKTRG